MATRKDQTSKENATHELGDKELDNVHGGSPAGGPAVTSSFREATKHPAKVTVPDIKV